MFCSCFLKLGSRFFHGLSIAAILLLFVAACGENGDNDENGNGNGNGNGPVDLCGNGIIDEGEDCDGDNLGAMTCTELGFYEGNLGCTPECTFDTSSCTGFCGDGEINGPEECDGDELGDATCQSLGFYEGLLSCSSDCLYDDSGCSGYCGDGVVDSEHGEVCDDGINDGEYGCMPDCTAFAPMYCGDGILNGPEECDELDLGGESCESLGLGDGELGCNPDCTFDTSGCAPAWDCGSIITDTRDGQEYETVQLGNLCWMATNLNTGTRIDSSSHQVDEETIEKFCYNDDPAMCDTFGGLYQWNQVMQYSTVEGSPGICPDGWRVPTDDEWKELEMHLGMTQDEADMANTWRGDGVGTALLEGGNSGFEGLLGGALWGSEADFRFLNSMGYYWTSSLGSVHPWRRCISSSPAYATEVGRWDTFPASFALSLRCVRD